MTKRWIADRNDPDMTTSPDRYISTRGDAAPTRFSDALLRGIAPDGGLYMPQAWPALPAELPRLDPEILVWVFCHSAMCSSVAESAAVTRVKAW